MVVGIQTTMQDKQMAHYLSYFAIFLSLVQTVAVTLGQVGNYSQTAMSRRMTAAEIKAEIYKFEALAGEYSDPQSRRAVRQAHVPPGGVQAEGCGDPVRRAERRGDKRAAKAEREKADTEMKASGNRGV